MVMRFVDLLSRTMMIAAFVLVLFSVPFFNASIAHATIGPTDPGGGGGESGGCGALGSTCSGTCNSGGCSVFLPCSCTL
jgi:hypothetical protein